MSTVVEAADRRHLGFGDADHRLHPVDLEDLGQRIADGQLQADLGVDLPDNAVHRCGDRAAGELEFGVLEIGLGGFHLGPVGVELGGGDHALGIDLPVAFVFRPGELVGGPGPFDGDAVVLVVHPGEDVAFLDDLAFPDQDLIHRSVELCEQGQVWSRPRCCRAG